jgi:phosphopantothenoylcysteine decarboxylase/phosphopantothenate--cysteine ligase
LVVSATAAPVVVVPAMNDSMWRNPGVRRNVQRLRENGYHVVEPSYGIEIADGLESQAGLGGPGVTLASLALLLAAIHNTSAAV